MSTRKRPTRKRLRRHLDNSEQRRDARKRTSGTHEPSSLCRSERLSLFPLSLVQHSLRRLKRFVCYDGGFDCGGVGPVRDVAPDDTRRGSVALELRDRRRSSVVDRAVHPIRRVAAVIRLPVEDDEVEFLRVEAYGAAVLS